jgi:hypothetical protein
MTVNDKFKEFEWKRLWSIYGTTPPFSRKYWRMSHDISCTGQDHNRAPAKYLEKRYSCGTVSFQTETFAASLWEYNYITQI